MECEAAAGTVEAAAEEVASPREAGVGAEGLVEARVLEAEGEEDTWRAAVADVETGVLWGVCRSYCELLPPCVPLSPESVTAILPILSLSLAVAERAVAAWWAEP